MDGCIRKQTHINTKIKSFIILWITAITFRNWMSLMTETRQAEVPSLSCITENRIMQEKSHYTLGTFDFLISAPSKTEFR